jgi:hypothetical protein
MMLLGVWLILKSAGPVIATHLQAGPMSLWPNDEWLGVELARIVPAIFVCLLICVSMLPPAEPTDHRRKGSTIAASNGGDLIEFAHKSVLILATCFAVSLLIFSVAELYQYGIATIVSGGISFAKIAIVFARTAPSVVLSYWVLLFLAREQAGQRMPFALMAAILAGTVALAAFLVALFFLQVDFLPQFREYSGGWDYVVFYVSANVLVAECAFVTMALFFRSSINGHETMKSLALLRRNASHA